MTMTCKDCLHYEVCVIVEHSTSEDEDYLTEFGCDDFKDRSKWVEQKHGRWEHAPDYAEYCSVCEFYPDDEENHAYDYCPNCGAKMDGERKDNE